MQAQQIEIFESSENNVDSGELSRATNQQISMIVAVSENNVIGKDNQLIWKLPNDLKRFKELTTNKTIVMGRKTFDSLGRVLPNRQHIVITRNPEPFNEIYRHNQVTFTDEIDDIFHPKYSDKEIFIIGGSQIYFNMIDKCNIIYLTRVHDIFDGDSLFPENLENFELSSSEFYPADDKHKYSYTFETYVRK